MISQSRLQLRNIFRVVSVRSTGWIKFDVSRAVTEWLAADGNTSFAYGFEVWAESNGVDFYSLQLVHQVRFITAQSRNKSRHPRMIIFYMTA